MKKISGKYGWKEFIIIFIFLQPFLDIYTSLSIRLIGNDFSSIGVIFRSLFMVIISGYILVEPKYSNLVKIYLLSIGAYLILFLTMCYFKGNLSILVYEIKSTMKTFYFPVVLVSLYEIQRVNRLELFNNRLLNINLKTYLLVLFISAMLGFGFSSYDYGFGSVGLFYSANEIGAIITILLPFIILPILKKSPKIIDFFFCFILMYSIVSIGTKTPFLGFLIYVMMLSVSFIFKLNLENKKYNDIAIYLKSKKYIIIGLIIIIIMLFLKSPIAQNMKQTYGHFFETPSGEVSLQNVELKRNKIISAISSSRDIYLSDVRESYKEAEIQNRLFGIGYYIKNETGDFSNKLIEMDFFDIYYRHGIIGFFIHFLPFLLLIFSIFKKIILRFNSYGLDIEVVSYSYSIFIGIFVGFLAGHILTSPAVSIYIIVVLLMLHYRLNEESTVIS